MTDSIDGCAERQLIEGQRHCEVSALLRPGLKAEECLYDAGLVLFDTQLSDRPALAANQSGSESLGLHGLVR